MKAGPTGEGARPTLWSVAVSLGAPKPAGVRG